jgi:hypothetical protein
MYDASKIFGYFRGFYFFVGFLLTLQVLHIFWFYLIVKMALKLTTTKIKDDRSDASSINNDEKKEQITDHTNDNDNKKEH